MHGSTGKSAKFVFDAGRSRGTHTQRITAASSSNAPEVVVLSACETAITQVTKTPDQFFGFPAAFLHPGARTVIATLWQAEEVSTALLMGRFYIDVHTPQTSPAEAMRQAQRWLRTAKADDLWELVGELLDEPDPVELMAVDLRDQLFAKDPEIVPLFGAILLGTIHGRRLLRVTQ